LEQTVGRAAQLERAAGLKAFAFEPHPRLANLAFDQRRLCDQSRDALRGCMDRILVDLCSLS
jgi:hypothetical protein